jgi:hypothetical protein
MIGTTAFLGAGADIADGGPFLMYTYTFASFPSFTMYCSAKLSPPVIEQTGSMLMSIFTRSGDFPANRTVPLTIPNVAGSSGGTGDVVADFSVVLPSLLCFPVSFGLHPTSPASQTPLATMATIVQPQIRLMLSLSFFSQL